MVSKILFAEPIAPRAINRHVPRDLEIICLKCLEKRPAQRYRSAAELAADLRHYLAGEPIHARAVTRTERAWRWCARRPLVAGLITIIAGLTILLLATVTAAWWHQREANHSLGQSAYLLQIAEAENCWKANDLSGARAALDACPAEFRNVEWHLLDGILDVRHHRLSGGGREVEYCANGQLLVTAGPTRAGVTLWKVEDYTMLGCAAPQSTPIGDLDISGDGALLLTTSYAERLARVWSLSGKKLLQTLGQGKRSAWRARFTHDGRQVISYGDQNTVFVWDAHTGETVRRFAGGEVIKTMAVSPATTLVALSSGRSVTRVTLWDHATGTMLRELPTYGASITSLAFSSDGRHIACGERRGTIRICKCDTAECLLTLPGPLAENACLAFDPSGRRLASAGADSCVHVWDTCSGRELLTLRGLTPPIHDLAFSRDVHFLAGSCAGVVTHVWDINTEQGAMELPSLPAEPFDLQVSSSGNLLASAYDNGVVRIWNTRRRELLRDLPATESVRTAAFSPDEQTLATGDEAGVVRVHDVATARVVHELKAHHRPLRAVAFSPDGRHLASAGLGSKLLIHNAASGRLEVEWPLRRAVRSIAWNSDGTRLATGDRAGNVTVCEFPSGRRIWQVEFPARISSLAWSPDDQLLAVSHPTPVVRICRALDGAVWRELTHTDDGPASRVAFSSDGSRLVLAVDGRSVSLWDVASGRMVLRPTQSPDTAEVRAIDPQGRFLATALRNGGVRLWRTAPLDAQ